MVARFADQKNKKRPEALTAKISMTTLTWAKKKTKKTKHAYTVYICQAKSERQSAAKPFGREGRLGVRAPVLTSKNYYKKR